MQSQSDCAGDTESATWLSGPILTFLNKVIVPALWLCFAIGMPAWILTTTGSIALGRDFYFVTGFAAVATVLLSWFSVHLQLVGYQGRYLLVANYWKKAAIPFQQVEAVESVWWYRGRLVRIRFNQPTPFGSLVYYMPKWAPFRGMFSAPEKELQSILASRT
ncbi:MAG: hypothetical protein J0H49_06215 [Acidobacteria bacterium]|nr:hypothetical protein [Acidobacteriota bacterium]